MRKTIFLVLSSYVFGTTLYVSPGGSDNNDGTNSSPFATIQKGINTSLDGDTIQVAPGTYFENVAFNGKSICLLGDNRATTIIDAGGNGPGIQAIQSLSGSAKVRGFTIQNGQGLVGGWPSESHRAVGGGVLVVYNNVFLEDLIIQNNTAEYGGGIFFQSNESSIMDLYFKNVDFIGNNSQVIHQQHG